MAITEPRIMAATPAHASSSAAGITSIEKRGSKTKNSMRISANAATLVVVAAISALTADGASAYAPGSQACSGKSAILIPSPITRKAKPTRTAFESYRLGSRPAMSAMLSVPVML